MNMRKLATLVSGFTLIPTMVVAADLWLPTQKDSTQVQVQPCEKVPECLNASSEHICETLQIGQTAILPDGLAVTVDSVGRFQTSYRDAFDSIRTAHDGYTFVPIIVSVYNGSNQKTDISRDMFTLALPTDTISSTNSGQRNVGKDNNNRNYLPPSSFPSPDFAPVITLNPKENARGNLIFEVPIESSSPLRVLCSFYSPSHPSTRYYVAWKL